MCENLLNIWKHKAMNQFVEVEHSILDQLLEPIKLDQKSNLIGFFDGDWQVPFYTQACPEPLGKCLTQMIYNS